MNTAFFIQRMFFLVVCAIFCFLSTCCVHAQEKESSEVAKPQIETKRPATRESEDELKRELKPGVWIYGQSNRFSKLGDCSAFDISPDGRTLVCCSSGSIKFFDLETDEITEKVQVEGDSYNNVIYSTDGRYVFAPAYNHRSGDGTRSLVRIFDVVDYSEAGSVSSLIEGEDNKWTKNFYIQNCAVSPDGNLIAISSHDSVQIREIESNEVLSVAKKFGYISGMAFSSDESELFITGNEVKVLDVETGVAKKKSESNVAKSAGSYANALATSYSKNFIALATGGGISVFDMTDANKRMVSLKFPGQTWPQSIYFSDDGTKLASLCYRQANTDKGESSYVLIIHDTETKKVLKNVGVPSNQVDRIRFTTDNQSIFLSGNGVFGLLEIDLENDDEVSENQYPRGPATAAAIHSESNTIITTTEGGEITKFDVESGDVLRKQNHSGTNAILLAPDRKSYLLLASWGQGDMTRFSYKTGKAIKSYSTKAPKRKKNVFTYLREYIVNGDSQSEYSQATPIAAKFSSDGNELFSLAMESRTVVISGGMFENSDYEQKQDIVFARLNTDSGIRDFATRLDREKLGLTKYEWFSSGAVHPDGFQVSIARQNQNQIQVFDTETDELLETIQRRKAPNWSKLDYSPDGKFLVGTSTQGLWVFDTDTWKEVLNHEDGHGQHLFSFSKEGRHLAVAANGKQKEVVVYDTETWEKIHVHDRSEFQRSTLALSDDGNQLLIGLSDCRMELLDFSKMGK
jgi:hypothetical protein